MLTCVDRVQVVVADRRAVASAFAALLDAEVRREDRIRTLAARRTVLALGTSEVELLEPDGPGPTAAFLAGTKGGLFGAGFAAHDLEPLRTHLQRRGVDCVAEAGQLFVAPEALGVPGLRVVLTPETERSAVGLVRHLYEVTLLVSDSDSVRRDATGIFGLDPAHFAPIRSEEFGYAGTLALFGPDRLDRMEIITPFDSGKTMGRFFARRGPCLYMCYAEADDLARIRARLMAHAPTQWTGPADEPAPDNLFVHPAALGGMMLGLSRTTFAWVWSGRPDRVVPARVGSKPG